MMVNIVIYLLSAFFVTPTLKVVESQLEVDPKVFICGESKIFHNDSTHNALVSNCKSGVWTQKKSEALDDGKRLCRCRY
ncbi:hypothetical protein [Aureibacter tunicatorum]|uniref:Uncharacterized protein n=1 Tax=Aureibacter tunicatorum TaxID=866807 RepID=A0AAE4BTT0_9BACT|nr:hypothetical protein [Aureibacter tunicatorum]MDR6239967.1 hypothetical protein [Aureibacter tunicatorum]BDD04440.1 hypothetical protein AUTU_19230 [Aureibacter tunicatorum]